MMSGTLPDGLWLNVGSGDAAPRGWVNIDGSWQAWFAARPLFARAARMFTGRDVGHWPEGIVCRDVRRGLGVAPGTSAVVYSSHLIEHLERHEGLALLVDAYRVLKPNGVCRVVTPDLAVLAQTYQQSRGAGDPRAADRFVESTLLTVSQESGAKNGNPLGWYRARTAFHFHKWLYDADSLAALFLEAGFRAVAARKYLDSQIPVQRLREVEHESRAANGAGVIVEATR
jgi:predicted SAM-dependent methyltransferase